MVIPVVADWYTKADNIPRSPNWRRKLRKLRSRSRLHLREALKRRASQVMSWKWQWSGKATGKGSKGKGRSWNIWGTPPKRKGEKKKDKDQEEDKQIFPGYDSLRSSSSSQPSVSELRTALKEAIKSTSGSNASDGSLVKAVQQIVGEDDDKEDLKNQQKDLNLRKKLVAKISRLKKAKMEKTRAWTLYKEELKKHQDAEQEKFKSDMEGIDLEIQKAMDKIEELDIDAATRDVKGADAMDMDAATNRELKEQLLLAQREQSNTARMLALLQTQFNAYVGQGAHGPMPSEPRIAASPSDLRKQRLNAIEKTGPTYPSQIPTFRLDEDRERSPRRSEPGGADSQELNKLG